MHTEKKLTFFCNFFFSVPLSHIINGRPFKNQTYLSFSYCLRIIIIICHWKETAHLVDHLGSGKSKENWLPFNQLFSGHDHQLYSNIVTCTLGLTVNQTNNYHLQSSFYGHLQAIVIHVAIVDLFPLAPGSPLCVSLAHVVMALVTLSLKQQPWHH